jgi:transcription-repair coupling factor (superfamily II helicase)
VIDELIDRYGEIPAPVEGLIDVAQIRSTAQSAGISEIVQGKEGIAFYTEDLNMESIGRLNSRLDGRISLDLMGKTCFRIAPGKGEKPLTLVKDIVDGYSMTVSE